MTLIFIFLSLVVFITIILAIVCCALMPAFYKKTTNKRLHQKGVKAEAVLLNMRQTGTYINNLPQVVLQIQVQPKAGRNFVTEAQAVLSFSDLTKMHIGGIVLVKYNPGNTREIMLVTE